MSCSSRSQASSRSGASRAGSDDLTEARWAAPRGLDGQRREEIAIALQAYREALALRLLGHD